MNKEEIPTGSVVEFLQDQAVQTAVVIGTKNQRLMVLSENNKEMNVSKNRILQIIGPKLDPTQKRDELIFTLQEISKRRKALAESINVEELWTLLEEEATEFSAKELAEFIFTEPDVDKMAAVQRAVLEDRFYFQYKSGVFSPRSKENIEQRKIQAQKEAEKKRLLELGASWLKDISEKDANTTTINEDLASIIEKLKDFALHGNNSVHLAFVKEIFKQANLNLDPYLALRLLIKTKVWREDENILLYQYDIRREFPEDVQKHAETIAATEPKDPLDNKRVDLSNIWTVTIDGEETRDIDDAISFEHLPDGRIRIGVHITDVSAYVEHDDPVDREARQRMTSLYLPDEKIPMLPSVLSENVCSLVATQRKRAFSFLFTLTEEGKIEEADIVPSFVCVDERLTYDQVNRQLDDHPTLKKLYELSTRLQEERKAKGAIIFHVPEVQALVMPSGVVMLKRYNQDEPAQTLVSEWMIAANALAASFFRKYGIPAIYRCQGEPQSEDIISGSSEHHLFTVLNQRRLLPRAELSVDPSKHCTLGVECYVSITSPIRRYVDLVLQRQLRHFILEQKPFYSQDELDLIITEINSILPKAYFVSRKWNRYWILKYLQQEKIRFAEALILDQNDRVMHVILPDYMLETSVLKRGYETFATGQIITVRVEKVNPREDIIRLQVV